MEGTEYLAPKTLDEALEALETWKGTAKLIAGGTNVMPNLRKGALSPAALIDLSHLVELEHIKENDSSVSVGAMTTVAALASSEIINKRCPILSMAAASLGNPLTRNRATIGGNLADASPAADMAPPLLALDAAVYTRRWKNEEKAIPIDRFFLGPNKTALEEDEIITRISFPMPEDPLRGGYTKLGLRNAMAISVVSIAVMLQLNGKMCNQARLALGAVAPKPIRAYRVENDLQGKRIDEGVLEECGSLLRHEISPISDIRASAQYREVAASVLFTRTVREALKGVAR